VGGFSKPLGMAINPNGNTQISLELRSQSTERNLCWGPATSTRHFTERGGPPWRNGEGFGDRDGKGYNLIIIMTLKEKEYG